MALLNEDFLNTTVAIGVNQNGITNWIGTGFFASKKSQSTGSYIYLVTNRHVVENFAEIRIRILEKGRTRCLECPVTLVENGFLLFVPATDEAVDLAVILLNAPNLEGVIDKLVSVDIDNDIYTSDEYLKNGGFEGSGVFMLGFPLGMVDESSNYPICRFGCIARFNSNEIQTKHKFMVDIQNFPGNSGSPIFSKPEIVSLVGTKPIDKCKLIGIVNSYIPYQDQLFSNQTKQVVEIRNENSGLAFANPAEYLKNLINEDLKSRNLV